MPNPNNAPAEVRIPPSVRIATFLREHGLLLGTGLAVLIIVTAEARKPESAEDAKRRTEIEQLAGREREQLLQNVSTWKLMREDERSRIRDIHQAANEPTAQEAMQRYLAWLETIPGQDKTRVLAESNPQRRAALVASLMKAKPRPSPSPNWEPGQRPSENGPGGRAWGEPGFRMSPPTREEMDSIFNVVARLVDVAPLASPANPDQRLEFHLKVFETYMRDYGPKGNSLGKPLDRATVDELLLITESPMIREPLSRGRSEGLAFSLGFAVFEDARRMVEDRLNPEEEQRLLGKLSVEERDKLDELNGPGRDRYVCAYLIRDRSPQLGTRLVKMLDRIPRLTETGPGPGGRRDGGPGRPGFGGPGGGGRRD